MDLRTEFVTSLQRGDDHDALLELVQRFVSAGMPPQEAYQVLHEIWLERGFNKVEEGSDLQDNLEYVLEKVWYECPATNG